MNKTKSNPISLTSLEKEQLPTIPSQEEFNKAFNEILEGSTPRYLNPKTNEVSTEKTSRIEVFGFNGMWLLEYDTNPENPHFWYQSGQVYVILRNKFSLQAEEMQSFMKGLVETQYKLMDTQPHCTRISVVYDG